MNTPNNAAALECVLDEMGAFIEQEESPNLDTLENWNQRLRATLTQPDATRPRAIWPDALSSPERHQLRALLECVDRRVLSLHEADQLVNLIADALTSQPSGEAVDSFLAEVRAELVSARAKFPGDRIMTIALAEEFGELCKAILDEPSANVRKEAVQTAVMAARVVLDGDGSVNDWRKERGLDPLVQPEWQWHDKYDLAGYDAHPSADAPGVAVDEAMVERALREIFPRETWEAASRESWRKTIQRALTAALAPKPEGEL